MTIAKLKELEQAATPGPWRWRYPSRAQAPSLVCPNRGMLLVMDAARSGMNGADIRFGKRSPSDRGGIMHKLGDALGHDPMRPDYPKSIPLPDAELIPLLRNLAPELIAVVEAARKALPYVERCPLEGSAPRFDELDGALTALHAKLAQEQCP